MISTYKDDVALPRGESIGPSLFNAIEGSRIAIVIFSEDYAGSSWCLEELAHIMKCRDEEKLIVMPIFYCVDPSEVRKQKGKFGEAFAKHEMENKNKVESWRKALVAASGIAGWEPKNIANGHEMKAIKEIVDTISDKLFSLTSDLDEDLVGMRVRMQELESQLEIGSGDVRMIGIWGIGGSGKTTLASSLCMKISPHFQDYCIVDNVREESSRHSLKYLQEIIISRLLRSEIKLQNVQEGKRIIKSRLRHSNVLIVLDDVDHIDQLDALAGNHNWFGSGSRIIITTRNEQLLISHNVDQICQVALLSHEEAIQLFNRRAYNEKKPVKDYETLSSSVVSYCAGLPLALTILGSFLCGKGEKDWRSTLERLKNNPEMEIVEKLKISYDGLRPLEKQLFLDIACFFRRKNRYVAMEIFEACDYHPDIGITVLTQKALITIVNGEFDMHDMVQEMGHYIVKGDHPINPEKHSRVWEFTNITYLEGATMENDKTEAIEVEGKYFSQDGGGDSEHLYKMISNMKKLRWLSVYSHYKDHAEGPNFLSNDLRYIYWGSYPRSSFPNSFQPMKLVVLKLDYGFQKQLWSGYQHIPHLKVLQLNSMKNLLCTPDFDQLPSLQKLELERCDMITEIHPSLGNHKSLEYIKITWCSKLRMFPTIVQMRKLKTLEITHGRMEFPEIKSNMESLVKLYLVHVGIDALLSSIGERCANLISLHLFDCHYSKINEFKIDGLKHLKDVILHRLVSKKMPIHIHLRQLTSLQKLVLVYCNLKDGEISSDIGELFNLRELDLSSNSFTRLHFSLSQLSRLKLLNVSSCIRLVELPELPSKLVVLHAYGCDTLKDIGDVHKKCEWLCDVKMDRSYINDGSRFLESMLQGNAIEKHNMIMELGGFEIAKGFIPPLVRGSRCRLQLPENWCNDFSGFLMCVVLKDGNYFDSLNMKQVMSGMESKDEDDVIWEESEDSEKFCTFFWYVSFASLKHNAWWNSTYKAVSFSLNTKAYKYSEVDKNGFGVRLVSRKSGNGVITETSTTQEESEFSHYKPKLDVVTDNGLRISYTLFSK